MDNQIIAKVTLQYSGTKPYMWAYTVKQGSRVLCSGGVYYNEYQSASMATSKIRREIEGRIDGKEYILEGHE